MAGRSTREQIIEAADRLFYERGFEHTSFADIAAAVGLSRGNFYYHFRTKDEILDAVISLRMARTGALLDRWERDGKTPAERIRSFIRILIVNQTKIMEWGCPVGTLTTELAKLGHNAGADAAKVFSLFRVWLRGQFGQLGYAERQADGFAMHVLARSQGVATLANAYRDKAFVGHEVKLLENWLDECVAQAKQRKE